MNNQSHPINIILPNPYFYNGVPIQNEQMLNNITQFPPGTFIPQNIPQTIQPLIYNNQTFIGNPQIFFANTFLPNQQQFIGIPNKEEIKKFHQINGNINIPDFNFINNMDNNVNFSNDILNKEKGELNVNNDKNMDNNNQNNNIKQQKNSLIRPILLNDNNSNNEGNYNYNFMDKNNYYQQMQREIKNENNIFKPRRNYSNPSRMNNENKVMINPYIINSSIYNTTNQFQIPNNNIINTNNNIQSNQSNIAKINNNNNHKEKGKNSNINLINERQNKAPIINKLIIDTKNKMKYYRCSFQDCNKIFPKECNLKDHIRTHTGEKPYKCNFNGCNKSFSQHGNLKKHEKVHIGDKKYFCNYPNCGKKFSASYNLKIHYRSHTGERPYKCNFDNCERSFYDKGNLKYHEKTMHLAENKEFPYSCEHMGCNAKFKTEKEKMDHHSKMEPECLVEREELIKLVQKYKLFMNKVVKDSHIDPNKNEVLINLKKDYEDIQSKLIDKNLFVHYLGNNYESDCPNIDSNKEEKKDYVDNK